jgi:hypothetical protein
VSASPAAQPDPTSDAFSSRPPQLLSIERCDDHLNPPWLPWSEWWIRPGPGRRRASAILSASTTKVERMRVAIDQPTIWRE